MGPVSLIPLGSRGANLSFEANHDAPRTRREGRRRERAVDPPRSRPRASGLGHRAPSLYAPRTTARRSPSPFRPFSIAPGPVVRSSWVGRAATAAAVTSRGSTSTCMATSPRADGRGRRRLALVTWACAAVACGGPDAPDAQRRFVDLYLDDGIEVCGGQLASYDRFIERAFALLGEDPEGFPVRLEVKTAVSESCHPYDACATPGVARVAAQVAAYHEIAHTIDFATDGFSAPPLQEGFASALGSTPFAVSPGGLRNLQQPADLFPEQLDAYDYTPLAVFTRFVIERYGIAAFREYKRAIGRITDPHYDDFASEFKAAFSESIDEAWPDFMSAPLCAYQFSYCGRGSRSRFRTIARGRSTVATKPVSATTRAAHSSAGRVRAAFHLSAGERWGRVGAHQGRRELQRLGGCCMRGLFRPAGMAV